MLGTLLSYVKQLFKPDSLLTLTVNIPKLQTHDVLQHVDEDALSLDTPYVRSWGRGVISEGWRWVSTETLPRPAALGAEGGRWGR